MQSVEKTGTPAQKAAYAERAADYFKAFGSTEYAKEANAMAARANIKLADTTADPKAKAELYGQQAGRPLGQVVSVTETVREASYQRQEAISASVPAADLVDDTETGRTCFADCHARPRFTLARESPHNDCRSCPTLGSMMSEYDPVPPGAAACQAASSDALIVAVMRAAGLTHLASHDADFDRVHGLTRYAPA